MPLDFKKIAFAQEIRRDEKNQECRVPKDSLTNWNRYHHITLYAVATVLSLSLVCSTLLFGSRVLEHVHQKKRELFIEKREEISSRLNKISARLLHASEIYEHVWMLRRHDPLPLEKYRLALLAGGGVTVTDDDLTAIPFTLISTLAQQNEHQKLLTLLRLVRDISAAPATMMARQGLVRPGIVYAPDGSFLAASPLLENVDLPAPDSTTLHDFVKHRIATIENVLNQRSATELKSARPFWILEGEDNAVQIAVPLFHFRQHIATLAVTIPDTQLGRFPANKDHAGFYILSRDRHLQLARSASDTYSPQLLELIRSNIAHIPIGSTALTTFRAGGVFIIAQRIAGPEWLAVYAYDWREILNATEKEFVMATLLCIAALISFWGLAWYIDRLVAGPLLHSEQELENVERLNQAIIDTLPIGIAAYAVADGTIILENSMATSMIGNAPFPDLRFYQDAIKKSSEKNAASATAVSDTTLIEMTWADRNGVQHDLEIVMLRTALKGSTAILFGVINIDDRKRNQTLLLKAQEAADHASLAKSNFISVISKEIAVPVRTAIDNLTHLKENLPAGEPQERTETICRSLGNLLTLVNDLLDTTSRDVRRPAPQATPTCLNTILELSARTFAPLLMKRHIDFYCATDPALDAIVEADEPHLLQVLQNLLGNASKFTDRGRICLASRKLREEGGHVWIRLEVADTGIGIPSSKHSTIFEPLTQLPHHDHHTEGTGLGLFLCKNLVTLMGGHIGLTSEPNTGSTFYVDIPVKTIAAGQALPKPLQSFAIVLHCEVPAWRAALHARLTTWGAREQTQPPGTLPTIVLRAWPHKPSLSLTNINATTAERTIHLSPIGPLTPRRHGKDILVTSLSSQSLLAAIELVTNCH